MMLERPRILLINALEPRVEVERRYPGLGLGYLVSSARKHLPEARIDFRIVDANVPVIAERFRPHLVGISSVSQNFTWGLVREYAWAWVSRRRAAGTWPGAAEGTRTWRR